jgi:serine/threonine-protein kinase
MPDLPPERLGEYELIRRLGVGGMAETFEALRQGPSGFQQRVCLKRILPSFEADPGFVEMFLREARLSALLHHAHIAQVLDFGVIDGTYYLALELIEGIDLRFLLSRAKGRPAPMPADLVAHIAYALGSALDFAHSAADDGSPAGIVHRDVSPSNVLLSTSGEVKLADFGIAKTTDVHSSIQSGALKGKLPYMAPEYALGGHFDARSDLFSLGVTLYECLSGRRPFDADDDLLTLEQARRGIRKPLSELAPEAPEPLVHAIESLLAPDPGARPAHAGLFLRALGDMKLRGLVRRKLATLVRSARDERDSELRRAFAATLASPSSSRPSSPTDA